MLDVIIKVGIIFLIIYCPLAFGAVHIFSFTVMEITIFTLGLCWIITQIFGADNSNLFEKKGRKVKKIKFSIRKSPLNYFALVFLGLIIVQLLPLPAWFVKSISPNSFAIYKEAWGEVPHFIFLSVFRYGTRIGFFKVLAYVGLFFLIINWAETRERITSIVTSLILIGSFEAIYGILEHISNHKYIWWYKKIWHLESATGTYINRNHLAGLLEMAIPMAFGLLLTMVRKKRQEQKSNRIGGLRGFLLAMNLEGDHYRARKVLLVFLIAMMTLALILSGSRGGMLSLTVAFLVMTLLLLFRRNLRRFVVMGLIIGIITLGYGFYVGLDPTIDRFERMTSDAESRMRLARTSWNIVRDFPLLGTGWGTYMQAYRRYQDKKEDKYVVDHVHHDWVELGAEMGYAGLGVVILSLLFCLGYFFYLWKKRKNSLSIGIGLGGMGALVSLALHSFTDFNMHIPANALLLSMVIGTTLMALTYQHQGRERNSTNRDSINGEQPGVRQEKMTISFPAWLRWPVALFIVGGFYYAVALAGKPFLAERIMPTLPDSTIGELTEPVLEDVCTAIIHEKENAAYFYWLALLLEKSSKADWKKVNCAIEELRDEETEKIRQKWVEEDLIYLALKKAILLDPSNPFYHLKLAWHMLNLGKSDQNLDQFENILAMVEREFDRAIYFMPESGDINFSVGYYWLWKSKVVEHEKDYLEAFDRFIHYFRRAYEINQAHKPQIQEIVMQYYPVESILTRIF